MTPVATEAAKPDIALLANAEVKVKEGSTGTEKEVKKPGKRQVPDRVHEQPEHGEFVSDAPLRVIDLWVYAHRGIDDEKEARVQRTYVV